MNPKTFCLKSGMSTKEFIAAAQQTCPCYSKVAHCLASNPQKYGVQLWSGLARQFQRRLEKRKLPARLYLRLSERDRSRLTAACRKLSYNTMQETLSYIVTRFLDEIDEATAPAATGTAANKNKPVFSVQEGDGNVNIRYSWN